MFTKTTLIVGVDVHQRRNVTLVMDGGGAVVDQHRHFANNRPGAEAFARYLTEMAQSGPFRTIHIAAEATNNYWLPFFCHLAEAPVLTAWPVTLYPFNPRLVA
ncbi:MAG: hypothetical protein R3204_14095, partial [Oceanospirillum sp.]|nr:hypothetical protein [Oceanospirillum sp.]